MISKIAYPLPKNLAKKNRLESKAYNYLLKKYQVEKDVSVFFKEISNKSLEDFIDENSLQKILAANLDSRIIFSNVSQEYIRLGEKWAQLLIQLGICNFFLVCGDQESFEHFCSQQIPCIRVHIPRELSQQRGLFGFTSKGRCMAGLKLSLCKYILEQGLHVVCSDIDALWLQNPLEYLEKAHQSGDLVFQWIEAFPKEIIKIWGFGVCTGFFSLCANSLSVKLIEDAEKLFPEVGCDQLALNMVLLKRKMIWQYPPYELLRMFVKGTPRYRFYHGLSHSIFGYSTLDGYKLVALPHNLFYRHHPQFNLPVCNSVVFHPNSLKDEEDKIAVFENAGIPSR